MNGLLGSHQNSVNIMANVTWTFANLHLSSTLDMDMPTTGTPGQMVAATPDLVENILSNLSLQDVNRARSASRKIDSIHKNSASLRKA